MSQESPGFEDIGMGRVGSILQLVSSMWDIGIAVLDGKHQIQARIGDSRMPGPDASVGADGGAVKLDRDLYMTDVSSGYRLLLDFERSKLRPKRLFGDLTQACGQIIELGASGPDEAPLELASLDLVSKSLMVHKVPDLLLHMIASFLRNHFDHTGVALYLDGPEPMFLFSGRDDSFKASFRHLRAHPELETEFEGDQTVLIDREFKLKNDEGAIMELHQLMLGPLRDEDQTVGHFLIGAEEDRNFNQDDLAWLELTSQKIVGLYKTACLERDRESQSVNLGSELVRLNEVNELLELDFRDLEQRWHGLMIAHEKLKQVIQILDVIKDLPRDESFIRKMIAMIKSFTRTGTVAICFAEIDGMHLLYQHMERPIEMLDFSELDAGIYHTMMDRETPFRWKGHEARSFYLPSGHPRVRNCVCIPMIVNGRVTGSVMVANAIDLGIGEGEVKGLERLIQFIGNDLRASFDRIQN